MADRKISELYGATNPTDIITLGYGDARYQRIGTTVTNWGTIGGSITAQTDLSTALAGKASTATFTVSAAGLVPAPVSSNGTKYLRDDGTWQVVAASGGTWGSITGTLSAQTDLSTVLAGKEPTITSGSTAQYWRGDKSWQTLNAAAVGLGNVSNTAQQPLDSSLTSIGGLGGTSGLLRKTGVGTYTLDTNAYATTSQLATVMVGANGTSGGAQGLVPAPVAADNVKYLRGDGTWQTVAASGGTWGSITGTLSSQTDLSTALAAKEPTITAGTTAQYWRGDKSWQTLDKTAVGLGSVDNTSDASKPVSTATQTALNLKQDADGDLTAIAALSGTSGLLKKTAANTWTLDTTSYATGGGSATGTNTGDETSSTILTKLSGASGGDTTTFLRADGTWVAPAGGGSLTTQANNTLFGNVSGATAVPASMTGTQATALLATYVGATATVAGVKGLVPSAIAGSTRTTSFLRGDGTWAVPTNATVWGTITGTLSNQTDLNTVLSGKLDTSHAGSGGSAHAIVVSGGAAGFITGADKAKLDYVQLEGVKATYVGNLSTSSFSSTGGATSAQGPIVADGVTLNLNDRFLLKDQTTASQNGVFQVTNQGVAGTSTTSFQRIADMDTWAELIGVIVPVAQGTTLAGSRWQCTVASGGTLGTTAITFNQFLDKTYADTLYQAIGTGSVAWGSITGTLSAQTDLSTALSNKLDTTHAGTGGSAHATVVSGGAAGFMTGTDKAKLDGITGTNTGDQYTSIASGSILGRVSAGSGPAFALTGTQATTLLDAVVGDTGSGGTKGLVPAPASGDAAAGKFLKADGTWTAPTSSGGTWGSITGTLSDQTDLQTALDGKTNYTPVADQATLDTMAGSASLVTGTIYQFTDTGEQVFANSTSSYSAFAYKGDLSSISLSSISAGGNASFSVDTGGAAVSGTSGDWYYLPNTLGADGQVLAITDYTTNTTGWVDPTSGGSGGIASVQSDTTPTLGGDLDVNGQKIVNNTTGGIVLQNDSITLEDAAATHSIQVTTSGVYITAGTLFLAPAGASTDAAASKGYVDTGLAGKQAAGSYAPASGSANYQAASSNLTAYAGAAWSAGVQVPTLTAANTVALKTVGSATGNLLDKASGDALYKPITPGVYTNSTATGAVSIDATGYDEFRLTVTGTISGITFTNLVSGKKYAFHIIQDGTGSHPVTLGTTWKFGTDVTSYTATTTASKRDLIGTWSDGTNLYVVGIAKGY